MKAATPTTLPSSSRRTQPTRQTRTNPPRNSVAAGRAYPNGRSLGAGSTVENSHGGASSPGFFPAITHFTDAITALPKDVIRHFTLLKEVDAKLHGPEDSLAEYITVAASTPAPERRSSCSHVEAAGVMPSAESPPIIKLTVDGFISQEPVVREESPDDGDSDLARRALFHHLRCFINEMLPALDEKNHVISTANEALNKQLLRLETIYPYVEGEISEEARYGSLNHWAYIEKPGAKRSSTGPERSRRDAAATNGFSISGSTNEGETVGTRSESRREAMLARKAKVLQPDSDFEEGRVHPMVGRQRDTASAQPTSMAGAGKRSHGNTKAKKAADGTVGITSVATNGSAAAAPGHPSKRRKTEKSGLGGNTTSSAPMEKTPSAITSSIAGKGSAGSPRGGTPAAEVGRKRARGGGAAGGTSRKRYTIVYSTQSVLQSLTQMPPRNNVTTSAAQPSSLASSPVHSTFATSKDVSRSSPVPGAGQRPASARARQNSTASLVQDASLINPRQRPSPSAMNKPAQMNGIATSAPDVNPTNGRGVAEIKSVTREIVNSKGDPLIENDEPRNDGDLKGTSTIGASINSKINRALEERSLKKEELHGNNSSNHTVQQIITTTNTRGGGKTSKTSTPTANSFAESQRSRSSRGGIDSSTAITTTATTQGALNPKSRSHKKGASAINQQLAAAAAAAASNGGGDEEGSSMQGDDEDDDDDSEPRYCYCNQVSYGEMVACDAGDSCPREWFHLSCVGLTKAPTKNGITSPFQILLLIFY
jgi:Inhibitor of growth proteins N-terminal histone-binding